jgi:hypothetical protein
VDADLGSTAFGSLLLLASSAQPLSSTGAGRYHGVDERRQRRRRHDFIQDTEVGAKPGNQISNLS